MKKVYEAKWGDNAVRVVARNKDRVRKFVSNNADLSADIAINIVALDGSQFHMPKDKTIIIDGAIDANAYIDNGK